MFDISPIQIMIVLAIALLVFGPKRLPELGRQIGSGLRGFKESLTADGRPAGGAHAAGASFGDEVRELRDSVAGAPGAEDRFGPAAQAAAEVEVSRIAPGPRAPE